MEATQAYRRAMTTHDSADWARFSELSSAYSAKYNQPIKAPRFDGDVAMFQRLPPPAQRALLLNMPADEVGRYIWHTNKQILFDADIQKLQQTNSSSKGAALH
jgi:hypothetical protein